MKWFSVGVNSNKFCENKSLMKSKISNYYKREVEGQYNYYSNNHIDYIELSNNLSGNITYENDDILIFGEVRIDNFINLKRTYNLTSRNQYELIRELYRIKKIKFLNEIYGDFNFIIIDTLNKEMYIIRDQLGLKEIFYYIENKEIIVASDLFLLNDFYTENEILSEYIDKYIRYDGYSNFEDTPYQNIKRILPGSYLKIDLEEVKSEMVYYWKLEDTKRGLENKTKDQIFKEFRELLSNSINNKFNETERIGVALSGGLDSTSIAAISKQNNRGNIKCYSGIFPNLNGCDEQNYIEETKNKLDLDVKYVDCEECGLLIDFPKGYFFTAEPHVNILNKKFSEKIFEELSKDKIKYIADGFFADHLLGGNILYLLDGNIKKSTKIEEIKYYAQATNLNIFEIMYKNLLLPKMKKGYLPNMDENLLKENKERLKLIKNFNNKDLIIQSMAISSTLFADRELAGRYNVESIHPFVDRRILEYIYILNGNLRLYKGTPKYLLRESVKELIPKSIYEKVKKTQQVELTQKGLRDNWNNIYIELSKGRITRLPFITFDAEKWREKMLKFRSGQEFDDKIFVYLSLEIWLAMLERKNLKIKFC